MNEENKIILISVAVGVLVPVMAAIIHLIFSAA